VFIRARGPGEFGRRYTTVEEVIEVDLDGRAIGAPPGLLARARSSFIPRSTARARGERRRAHPSENRRAVHDLQKPLLPLYGGFDPSGLRLALEGIPTYERSITITTRRWAKISCVRWARSGVLDARTRHHRASESVEEAALDAIFLNDLATINYEAALLGDPEPISEEDKGTSRPQHAGRYTEAPPAGGGRPRVALLHHAYAGEGSFE